MRFIPVEEGELREATRTEYNKLAAELKEFMNMNVKTARVVFGKDDYVNINSARNSIRNAIERNGLPIKVRYLKENVYLIRTDI